MDELATTVAQPRRAGRPRGRPTHQKPRHRGGLATGKLATAAGAPVVRQLCVSGDRCGYPVDASPEIHYRCTESEPSRVSGPDAAAEAQTLGAPNRGETTQRHRIPSPSTLVGLPPGYHVVSP